MSKELQKIGKEWLNNIPIHWEKDRLKDICERVVGGGTPKSSISEYWDGGDIIWVSPTDFSAQNGNKIIEDSAKKITELGMQKSSATLIPKGTVVMSSRASIGEPKIAGCDITTNQGFVSYVPSFKIDSNFLFYLIDGHLGEYFAKIASGTTFMEITRKQAKHEHIPHPPLPEQKTIANYLDKACKRIDKIIDIKQKQLERIKTIRKSKIDELVCFGNDKNKQIKKTGLSYLPDINKKWNIDRFKDVARLRNEKTDEKSDENNYLELEDIDQGTGNLLSTRNTLEVESKVTKFYKGDVLFGKLRPYLEKYHYAEFDGKCTGEILAFEPFRINGKFLMYLLASKWFIDFCSSMAYGAKMPRVNWNSQLAMVYFPLPSEAEQEVIVKQLDILSEKTHKLKEKLNEQISTLQTYRKSLIYECVTGEKQVWEGVTEKVN